MSSGFTELIDLIRDGESVSAAIANRPTRQNDQNVRYLRDVIEAALLGETVFARNKVVEVDVKVGMAVYYDYVSQTWKRALGGVETVSATGELRTTRASQVWGVIYRKLTSTSADILLFGTANVNLTEAILDTTITEGTLYFLSNSSPGSLTSVDQPVSVAVIQTAEENADGTHKILVNTSFQDLLKNHRHYRFSLEAVPAGTNVIPDLNGTHSISNPDATIEGWLPANHAIFEGNAPEGAQFGYNISVSQLNDLWPPVPVSNAIIEIVRGRTIQPIRKSTLTWTGSTAIAANGVSVQTMKVDQARIGDRVIVATDDMANNSVIVTEVVVLADGLVRFTFLNTSEASVNLTRYTLQVILLTSAQENLTIGYVPVPGDLVTIDRNGIWWMSNCYNEIPWPLAFGEVTSASESESESESCPTSLDMQLNLWFTKAIFHNTSTAVLSLQATDTSGLVITCVDDGDPAATGHLLLDLDLGLALSGDDDATGYLAFKSLSGNRLSRGPVLESIQAGSANVALASDLKVGNRHYGKIVITVDNEVDNKELSVDTVRLDGVTEEYYEETLALGFDAGQASEFRGRIHIPESANIPAGTKMKFRFRVLSRAAATLPQNIFSITYRRVPKPSATLLVAAALPTVDVALADQPTAAVTFSAVDMYFEFETEVFAIVSGDTILFTISRASTDSYGGNLLLLRQRGVLVAGS